VCVFFSFFVKMNFVFVFRLGLRSLLVLGTGTLSNFWILLLVSLFQFVGFKTAFTLSTLTMLRLLLTCFPCARFAICIGKVRK
jgi:hypothetical protein